MALLKNKLFLAFFLISTAGVAVPSIGYAANPFKGCASFFGNLFTSKPLVVLEVPPSTRVYPKTTAELLEQGELQRAIWRSHDVTLTEKIEKFLKTADIQAGSEAVLKNGTTGAKKIGLHGMLMGKNINCNVIQKSVGAENEVAFYELEKLFGLNFSPVTVERVINGKKNSFQIFLDNAVSAEDLRRIKKGDHGSMALDMYDYLTANYDRPGNYLIALENHRIVTMDAGFAFSSVRPASMKPYSFTGTFDDAAKSFYIRLKQRSDDEIVQTLKSQLSVQAIQDVLKRRKNLIEFIEKNQGIKQ